MTKKNNIGYKLFFVFLSLVLIFASFTGCPSDADDSSNSDNSDNSTTPDTSDLTTIYLLGASSGTWNIWAWKDNGDNDVNYDTKSWPGGTYQLTNSDSNGVYTTMKLDKAYDLGILFVHSSGNPQTADIIVPKAVLSQYKTLYFVYGDTNYYTNVEDAKGIKSGEITSSDGQTVKISILGYSSVAASDFTVKDSSDSGLTVSTASLSETTVTLTLSSGDVTKTPYTISYKGKSVKASISPDVIDEAFIPADSVVDTLGLTISGSDYTFTTWAPTASDVKLLLFTSVNSLATPDSIEDMTKGEKGIWSTTIDASSYTYYKYRITVGGSTYDVADIWSYVASPDSVASQIVSIDDDLCKPTGWDEDTNPFDDNGAKYSDAVIYEMHIRDWSRAFVSTSTGKFEDITDALNTPDGEFYTHLHDLGVTHVQILPSFDYAQKNSDSSYNWGYNPYNYNVPEGRYVETMTDGTDAVLQMREMIKAFHDAGIAVIMDVVYNHTSGTGTNSLYDMTVPEYFYRMTDGSYSNGSGCGNEVATNHKMVSNFVINSLEHWMNDYHVNGFRFDLMGCHEKTFMKNVYNALYTIDNNVMVYGEPWTGGTSAVSSGCTGAVAVTGKNGVAAFDDEFRNAIKGGEFGGFQKGHVQGTYADDDITEGLIAGTTRNGTSNLGATIHYVECHDNYTLFDKLAISYLNKTSFSGNLFTAIKEAGLTEVKKQNKLAAAYVILAQGTPFFNGGQEFMRTKQGNENSYISSDTINAIDLVFKDTYSDVYNTYKGLLAFRKAHSSAFGSNADAEAEKISAGLTKYVAGTYCVYFNATSDAEDIDATGYSKVYTIDESDGSVDETEPASMPTSVPAKSFVILGE